MKCPVCKDVTLLMAEKKGIEIDYCPECRGIWLDRGELEKIIERSSRDGGYGYDSAADSSKQKCTPKQQTKKKRGSMLGDLFEMFGGGED
ncbi:MAG TPA: zf-TFIIB domain-containing protein [Candidatus Eubacterium avistercoris]|uniref:Zf-TFIIB domain-containing protein n=1 Tax=Candidatus Eubacterium avistercoris TaxID=2838567 RepID=A0A9D2D3U6_9FIRM|nr:zf-TFIIB domain-containing protein [Candidatus Eubacterium avistercoris]